MKNSSYSGYIKNTFAGLNANANKKELENKIDKAKVQLKDILTSSNRVDYLLCVSLSMFRVNASKLLLPVDYCS